MLSQKMADMKCVKCSSRSLSEGHLARCYQPCALHMSLLRTITLLDNSSVENEDCRLVKALDSVMPAGKIHRF